MGEHVELRRGFSDRLAHLRQRTADLVLEVADAVEVTTRALLEGNVDAARAVAAADADIDRAVSAIEHEVIDLIALQAPVAFDLRFLLSTQRAAQEVERCGDLVSSIARRVPRLPAATLSPEVRALLYAMGAEACEQLRAASTAYLTLDERIAEQVVGRDDEVDELQERLLHQLFSGDATVVGLEPTVELALIARFYERVADHAVVIAERVRFTIDGAPPPGDHDSA